MTDTVVTILVGIVIIGLLVWGEGMLPIPAQLVMLLQAVTVIGGALLIARKAGVL